MPRTVFPANIVGPQIRRRRLDQGLTQDELAAHCRIHGFALSRSSLAQIEMRFRYVTDQELVVIAKALGTKLNDLVPDFCKSPEVKRKRDAVSKLRR